MNCYFCGRDTGSSSRYCIPCYRERLRQCPCVRTRYGKSDRRPMRYGLMPPVPHCNLCLGHGCYLEGEPQGVFREVERKTNQDTE